MKNFLIVCAILFAMVFAGWNVNNYVREQQLVKAGNTKEGEVLYAAKVKDGKIFLNSPSGEEEVFLRGVNIGLGKPGHDPGDIAITKNEYMKWFTQIADLNVKFIRVYTLQSPDFYRALAQYNKYFSKPIYLIHGAYVNEKYLEETPDMQDPKLKKDFKNEVKNVIDAVHGDANIPYVKGHASGKYNVDVSQYVVAYLLGIEFDGVSVENTNKKHPEMKSYKGKYLYTVEGS
ncbi:MAG: family 2 glycosyl transferase, partial [Anaerovoracaceae bacterium]